MKTKDRGRSRKHGGKLPLVVRKKEGNVGTREKKREHPRREERKDCVHARVAVFLMFAKKGKEHSRETGGVRVCILVSLEK